MLARNRRGAGRYVLEVRVTDTAGNSATRSTTFNL